MVTFFNTIVQSPVFAFFHGLGWLLVVLFVVGIIVCLFALSAVFDKRDHDFDQHFLQTSKPTTSISPQRQRWNNIVSMFQSRDVHAWRMAVIDADSLLEEMITGMGYRGATFGEKLKDMHRDNIPWLQAAWDVHLLRNKLAHEGSRYPLNERESYRAYKIYENILFGTGFLA